LNQSYVNGNNVSSESLSGHRPESPATFSTNTTASRRKSGGSWLKRLVSGGSSDKSFKGNKRASTVFESMAENGSRVDMRSDSPPAKRMNGSVNGNGSGNTNGNGNGNGIGVVRKDMGPPAPKLPELNQLKAKVDESTGSLGGGDMFANIGK